jgi:mannose-6-phosphate isomerase
VFVWPLVMNNVQYPWGKKGKESLAARLCEQTPGTDFKIDESKEYSGRKR